MTLHLLEGFGVELELMIVDADTLDVRPIADALLAAVGEPGAREVERGAAAWSNELPLHVVEMKTNGPVSQLGGVAALFADQVRDMEAILAPLGARLMPTGMHPWMDPDRELRLWPHEDDVVYQTFHRIFDCRGHGWANLQSTHLNVAFADDDELLRLLTAIRTLLPILPAVAASTPFVEGRRAPELDHRLAVYASNARRVPSVSGRVIPEPIYSRTAYEGELLAGIYRDLEPLDPEGVIRHEWVNARGAIVRFDRMAVEVRTLDAQEHPGADLAIVDLVATVLRALVDERVGRLEPELEVERLAALHDEVVRVGGAARGLDSRWLRALLGRRGPRTAREVWVELVEACLPRSSSSRPHVELILNEGSLAERILAAATSHPSKEDLHAVYAKLCRCLREGAPFRPGAPG